MHQWQLKANENSPKLINYSKPCPQCMITKILLQYKIATTNSYREAKMHQ